MIPFLFSSLPYFPLPLVRLLYVYSLYPLCIIRKYGFCPSVFEPSNMKYLHGLILIFNHIISFRFKLLLLFVGSLFSQKSDDYIQFCYSFNEVIGSLGCPIHPKHLYDNRRTVLLEQHLKQIIQLFSILVVQGTDVIRAADYGWKSTGLGILKSLWTILLICRTL